MSNMEQLTQATLEEIFGQNGVAYHLLDGTIVRDDKKQILISTETIYGMYKALSHETGEAWKVVMKNAGYVWGQRLVKSLSQDLVVKAQKPLGEISTADFCKLVEGYLAHHGWGVAQIDLGNATQQGIVRISLHNSISVDALGEVNGPVDFLVTGMLRGIFEFVADRELECVQVCCQRAQNSNACEFLLSAPERINTLEEVAGQVSVDDAIDQLRAA